MHHQTLEVETQEIIVPTKMIEEGDLVKVEGAVEQRIERVVGGIIGRLEMVGQVEEVGRELKERAVETYLIVGIRRRTWSPVILVSRMYRDRTCIWK